MTIKEIQQITKNKQAAIISKEEKNRQIAFKKLIKRIEKKIRAAARKGYDSIIVYTDSQYDEGLILGELEKIQSIFEGFEIMRGKRPFTEWFLEIKW